MVRNDLLEDKQKWEASHGIFVVGAHGSGESGLILLSLKFHMRTAMFIRTMTRPSAAAVNIS